LADGTISINYCLTTLTDSFFVIIVSLYPSPKVFFKNSGVPMHCIYPSFITTIRSASASASSIPCVVNITTLFFFKFLICYHILLFVLGSSPDVGSSRNTIFGSPMAAMASDNLLRIPPENVEMI